MSFRSLFLAGKDGYQASHQLDGVTPGERAGMVAAPAINEISEAYWSARGAWSLDTGRQSGWLQTPFDHWTEALQAAMELPERKQTADVVIRCRAIDGGGVNPFDKTNLEPVTVRLERLEQEWTERLSQDGGRHEVGANGSPTGRTGWSWSRKGFTYVVKNPDGVTR